VERGHRIGRDETYRSAHGGRRHHLGHHGTPCLSGDILSVEKTATAAENLTKGGSMLSLKMVGSITLAALFAVTIACTKAEPPKTVPVPKAAVVEKAQQLKPQTDCPVMGGKIDKKYYADFEGKRVYFCCPGCIPEFNKEPAKYLKKLEEMGQEAENVPAQPANSTSESKILKGK
jgi:YHS domain-containing protein